MLSPTLMSKKSDLLIPFGLILLCFVPIFGGAMRISELTNNSTITPQNERFFTAPSVVVAHIICSLVYGLLGALQFSRGFRRKFIQWHRKAGTVLVFLGFTSALTGLWMTQTFPHVPTDGPTLYWVRIIVGVAMTLCLLWAVLAIRQKQFKHHGAWMIRAYALGMGAGTQVFTHLPWVIALGGIPTGLERDAAMAAGWLINALLAEWILWRKTSNRSIIKAQY
jgi:uncharacterized membrane protein